MTPKEKARDLINKFNCIVLDTHLSGSNRGVIDCSLISVYEILKLNSIDKDFTNYWEEVKQELLNLKYN
jgi:hypothetical protein